MTFWNIAKDAESHPPTAIVSVEQLSALLATLSSQQPGFVELESTAGDRLQLGIGGQFACAQFTTHDDKPHYLCAKARTVCAKEHVEFLCGGTPTPIPPELCISFEEAVRIAEHFFNTGDRDLAFEWVEI